MPFMRVMTTPGSEQALSLNWALQAAGGHSSDEAMGQTCDLFGVLPEQWARLAADDSWFVGDPRWRRREDIEARWNARHASATNVWLDENSWHMPLWQRWLRSEKMVLAANLEYLTKLRGRGTVGQLADFIGRNRTTASKWAKWKEEGEQVRVPPSTSLPKILDFFDLPASLNLHQEPLFLGRAQVRDAVLRVSGRHYLDCMSGDCLRQAVDYLADESARQARKNLEV